MKLRPVKVRDRRKGGEPFLRRDITVPIEALRDLGWADGVELEWEVVDDELRLRLAKKRR